MKWGGAGLRAGIGLGEEEGRCPAVELGNDPQVACPPQAPTFATIPVHSFFEQCALHFIKQLHIAYILALN